MRTCKSGILTFIIPYQTTWLNKYGIYYFVFILHARIQRGAGSPDPPPPLDKSQKYIGFLSNTGPDPLQNHKAAKPVSAIIGTPAKRHLNGI